jgi:hypothetical protein
MDEESREKLIKKEYFTYSRRNKELITSPSDPKPPHIRPSLPLNYNPPP